LQVEVQQPGEADDAVHSWREYREYWSRLAHKAQEEMANVNEAEVATVVVARRAAALEAKQEVVCKADRSVARRVAAAEV